MVRLLLGLLMTAVFQAGAEPSLRVRPHVVVPPGSDVRLSQLVDAVDLSPSALRRLNSVVVSKAPAEGERQELTRAALMAPLRAIVEGERVRHGRLHVVLPKAVIIDTLKRDLDADLITRELLSAWQPLCADCQLAVEALSLPQVSAIRDWSLRLKPELPRGGFSVPVELTRESGAPLNAWISGRLLVKRRVPVARRLIAPGERLSDGDVAWEHRETTFSVDGIPAAGEIAGRRARQGLRAGDVMWSSMLERERAIRRGDLVQVRSGEDGWEVSLSVVAQQDANVGDIINLKNPRTNTVLTGEVVGRGEVVLR